MYCSEYYPNCYSNDKQAITPILHLTVYTEYIPTRLAWECPYSEDREEAIIDRMGLNCPQLVI